MDDLFTLLFVVIFILGPIIEAIRKKGQTQQPPQIPPRPSQQERPTQVQQRTSAEEAAAKPREAAAAMIPDDLWQVLTGEARPAPQVPAPAPVPSPTAKQRPWDVVYIPAEDTEDEEAEFAEDVNVEARRTSREAVLREHAARHRPAEALTLEVQQANIISLETPLPSSADRHAAFHKRIDAPQVVAATARSARHRLGLIGRSELQRAFVLQEIFGKPRGLE